VATAGLEAIVEDDDEELEIREHAIFSLSQQGIDRAFPALRKVALESRHPQLREQAFFWLAQHDDPRVIDLLEEVLLR
jgi:HEAT repeat protein